MKNTIDMAREAGAMFEHMMWLERDLLPVFQRFEALVRADEREAIRTELTRIVIVPTLTHGTLAKLSDVDAAIRARGNT
jgi:hypothetical protein